MKSVCFIVTSEKPNLFAAIKTASSEWVSTPIDAMLFNSVKDAQRAALFMKRPCRACVCTERFLEKTLMKESPEGYGK